MLTFYLSMLAQESDRADFAALYERCKAQALHLALGIVQERPMAEDAVHEGFVYLAENYQRLSQKYDRGLDGYFFQCVECRAKNLLRPRKKELPLDDCLKDIPYTAASDSPERHTAARERLEEVISMIQALPEQYRTVLELSCTGWTAGEIAQAEGLSKEVVQKRLERARKMVRTAVEGKNDE